jgi:hypothetical protein
VVARVARALLARASASRAPALRRSRPELALDAPSLAGAAAAVRDAALRLAWRRANPESSGLTRRHLAALVRLLESRSGARVALPGGWSAARERGRVVLARTGNGRLRPVSSRPARVGRRSRAAGRPAGSNPLPTRSP